MAIIDALASTMRKIKAARAMRRIDSGLFQLEMIVLKSGQSIEAYKRVTESIDNGSMR